MITSVKRALRFFPPAAAPIALLLLAPSIGLAQQSQSLSMPSTPSYAVGKVDVIRGTISGFNGATTMYVRDTHGYIDNVTLHKGTIINPTGIRLEAGYPVTISGHPHGSTFVADQIDTPFRRAYVYAPAVYPYPYPYPIVGWGWGWRPWR
jgi:hypothetical protein